MKTNFIDRRKWFSFNGCLQTMGAAIRGQAVSLSPYYFSKISDSIN